ncbi:F-box protein, partial [Trifolium pratense]
MERKGATIESGLIWMKYRGCILDQSRPYRGTWRGDRMQHREPLFYIEGYNTIRWEDMQSYLRNMGPIIVGFPWIGEMNAIRGEIYQGPTHPMLWGCVGGVESDNHAVVVIGYGCEEINGQRVDYWTVQNSHGVHWGKDGYGRISMAIRLPNGNRLINGGVAPRRYITWRNVPQRPLGLYIKGRGGKRGRFSQEKKQTNIQDVEKAADEAPRPGGMNSLLGVEHSRSMIPVGLTGMPSTAAEPKLLSGLKFYFSGEYDLSYKKYLEDLGEGGGGAVLKSKDEFEVGRDANLLAVYNLDRPQGWSLLVGRTRAESDMLKARAKQLRHPLFFAPCHFVHHLIDFNQLPVIDIGQMFYIYGPKIHTGKVVVATCEMGQPLALLTYDTSDVPKIFQGEDNSWRCIPTMPESSWGNICLFKGWQPCVTDKNGRTLMIGENFSIVLLANPVFGGNVKFLVESECDLLLVDCYGIDSSPFDKDIRFDVFRLDEKEKKWVKLTTL